MEAYAIDELGRPGSVRDVPIPEPAEGQVRIRVAAAGLNPFDGAVALGLLEGRMEHRFPLVPGVDASGTVDAVGPGVNDWSVGDDVFGSTGKLVLGEGTFAEFATMSAGTIARKPSSLDHAAAAAIPIAGVTALAMADALTISKGDVIVVVGATGGVGSYVVQIAAARGAHVVAIGRKDNERYARELGAAEAIDYTAGDVADAIGARYHDGVEAIADTHGDGEALARLAERVRSGGRVVSCVGAVNVEALARAGVQGANVNGMVNTAALDTLVHMVERNELKIPEIRSLPLSDAGEAFAAIRSGHTRGKIVILPSR